MTSFLNFLVRVSVESYARLHVKTSISIFSNYTETTPTTYDTRYRYHEPGIIASSSSQQVPRSYCCTKRVTPFESSHLPTSADSAHAARGRCFDPKRAATAPGCRACSASPEHRVGSLLIVGQDQTQAHSSSSTRGSSATPDDGSHIHRIVRPRCRTESSWLRAGRVWACTQPLQFVHATAELVYRGRVIVLVSYVMSTAAVGRVILYYSCIRVPHVNPNPTRYQVVTYNRSDLNLCLQPVALIILKL